MKGARVRIVGLCMTRWLFRIARAWVAFGCMAPHGRAGAQDVKAQNVQAPLEVRGRFLADPGPRPLAGAYVTLLNARGLVSDATLTNEAGLFALTAPMPGRYTVHAENIGYVTREAVLDVPSGRSRLIELRSSYRAIDVEGITAEVDRECRVPAATAERWPISGTRSARRSA